MNRVFVVCCSFLFLAGCADSHHTQRIENSATRLNSQDSIYISVSLDGVYGDRTYNGSGLTTSQIINSAFLRKGSNVHVSRSHESFEDVIASAKGKNYEYVVYPTILHWEDRATEWSAKPDKVEIKIVLYDLNSNKSLESIVIKGKSGLATFGGDHPQDLLRKPIEEFVSTLY